MDMVEKVARALNENFVASGWLNASHTPWDALSGKQKAVAMSDARAAIEATGISAIMDELKRQQNMVRVLENLVRRLKAAP